MEKLKRRLQRAIEKRDELLSQQRNASSFFDYWSLGYYTAKVVMLEEMIEEQEELLFRYKNSEKFNT